MEVIVSVAVIAVLSGIMIPSAISINNSLTNRQADDYAKSIYMAAQTQLSTLRAAQPKTLSAKLIVPDVIPQTDNAELESEWSSDLRYAVSGRDQEFFDNVLLPVGSIDDTLRSKKIMIEYNSFTGEIRSVFFLNETATATDFLTYDDVIRSAAERKAIHLGYYQADSYSDVTLPESYTETLTNCEILSFDNNYDNGDGRVTVLVPIPDGYKGTPTQFADSLSVKMTITGKTSDATKVIDLTGDFSGRTNKLTATDLSLDGHPAVGFSYILDSVYTPGFGFGELVKSSGFLIGENVSLSVEITDTSDVTTFEGVPQSLPINPLYAKLSGGTLEVANARNLQNLNKYAASDAVSTVKLSDNIVWNADKLFFTPLKNVCGFQEFDGNGKTISGLTIDDSTILGNSVGLFTALTASDKDNRPVIKDLTLDDLTISLDNSAGKSVGAIIGSATDVTVSNCAATDISFTLDNTNAATCVGGLVGVMKGGTLEEDTVSGTITKKSGEVAGYYVGGAVGKDETGNFTVGSNVDRAAYSKVNADVELKSWGGTPGPASAGDPSGLGVNVGKFVGHVDSGTFSNCSGTGESDKSYQFLGQIDYTSSVKTGTTYYEYASADKPVSLIENAKKVYKTDSSDPSVAAQYYGLSVVKNPSINTFNANLTKCKYSSNSGDRYQVIGETRWLFSPKSQKSAQVIEELPRSSGFDNATPFVLYDPVNETVVKAPSGSGTKTTNMLPIPDGGLSIDNLDTSCIWRLAKRDNEGGYSLFKYDGYALCTWDKDSTYYNWSVAGDWVYIYPNSDGSYSIFNTSSKEYCLTYSNGVLDWTKTANAVSSPSSSSPSANIKLTLSFISTDSENISTVNGWYFEQNGSYEQGICTSISV